MKSRQVVTIGHVNDAGVNFATVYDLTLVSIHMSFSLPLATSGGE